MSFATFSVPSGPDVYGCDGVGFLTFSQPVAPETPSIENGAHETKKLLLKTEKVKILHSEVNLVMYYSSKLRWTKHQNSLYRFT